MSHSLERVGAAAGVAHVVVFLAIINAFPAIPIPSRPIAEIAESTAEDSTAILWSGYAFTLVIFCLLVFGAALASRLTRAGESAWGSLALVGTAALAVALGNDGLATFVRAVEHGVRGDALWTAYPAGPDGVEMAIPMGVLMLAVAFGGRAAFPRYLCVWAGILALAYLLGGGGVAGDEVDGGPLGAILVLGFVGTWAWAVPASVHMWRHPQLDQGPVDILVEQPL